MLERSIDFGLTSNDYAKHRAGFPVEFFSCIAEYGIGKEDQTILDLGTGTGTLARGFAKQGAKVTGVDVSEDLIAKAKLLSAEEDVEIDYLVGKAEDIEFAEYSFDCVTAGQCWHWFERREVAKKLRKIIKKDGQLVIAHFDWIPITGNVVDATEKLILKYNPDWHLHSGVGIYPEWYRDVAETGFANITSYTFDLHIPYSHLAWRGRIRASAGVGASLSEDKVHEFDQELKEILTRSFPEDPLYILHRTFTLICTNV